MNLQSFSMCGLGGDCGSHLWKIQPVTEPFWLYVVPDHFLSENHMLDIQKLSF